MPTPRARVLALGSGLIALGLLGPRRVSALPSVCVARRLFGHCPACGVTRSVAGLLRGDVSRRPRRLAGIFVLVVSTLILVADLHQIRRARSEASSIDDPLWRAGPGDLRTQDVAAECFPGVNAI